MDKSDKRRGKDPAVIRAPKKEVSINLHKKCLVCGDKATGFNFNALTCESCKAFFRRHLMKPKEYKCPFSNNCDMTTVTRKFCQKCRLNKCLSIGMVKNRTNKKEKRRIIEGKRERQRESYIESLSYTDNKFMISPNKKIIKKHSVLGNGLTNNNNCSSVVDTILNTNIENQLHNNKHYDAGEEEENGDDFKNKSEFKERCKSTTYENSHNQSTRPETNSMEAILSEVVRVEFEAFSSANINHQEYSRELNEIEKSKLNELIVANKSLHAPVDFDLSQLVGEAASSIGRTGEDMKFDPRIITIVNLTAFAIRRFIKMAKKINAFKSMCEEDQVALLKGGCIELMVLRSTMTYDESSKEWKLSHVEQRFSSIHTDVLKCAENLYHKYSAFILSFEERWRLDENIILIMTAILLFTPDRPRVQCHDIIKSEQNSYYYLLRRYLESLYPGCKAKSDFLKLIQKILELRIIAEEVTGIYLNVGPVEPLLMEIIS